MGELGLKEIARQFAEALDRDDFVTAGAFMSSDCVYGDITGPANILKTYAEASDWGKTNLDSFEYKSEIEKIEKDSATILYHDYLMKDGKRFHYQVRQRIEVAAGKILKISSMEDAEQKGKLKAFFKECGLNR